MPSNPSNPYDPAALHRLISRLYERVEKLERSPRATHTSVRGGSFTIQNELGEDVARFDGDGIHIYDPATGALVTDVGDEGVVTAGFATGPGMYTGQDKWVEIGNAPGDAEGVPSAIYFVRSNERVGIVYGSTSGGLVMRETNPDGSLRDTEMFVADDIATINAVLDVLLFGDRNVQLSAATDIFLQAGDRLLGFVPNGGEATIDNMFSALGDSMGALAGSAWSSGSALKLTGGTFTTSNTSEVVSFDASFPNGVVSTGAWFGDDVNNMPGSGGQLICTKSVTTSGLTVAGLPGSLCRVNWMAMGW